MPATPPGTVILPLLVAAALIASMLVFFLLGGRRDRDAAAKGAQLALGAADFVVHWFMWLLAPAERLLLRTRVSPDALNFAGLGCGALAGAAIAGSWLAAGGWAIAVGGVFDVLDGRIARARRLSSRYGAFVDSTLDRFVEVFAFLGFAVYLAPIRLGPLSVACAMAGSLLVSYARARGESTGIVCKGGLMQRAERLVLLCGVCIVEEPVAALCGWSRGWLSLWAMGLIAAGTFGTAIYRTVWIARRLRERPAGSEPC